MFIMKPEYIDNLSNMYDLLFKYTKPENCPQHKTISHHFLTKYHFEKMAWLDKIKFSLSSCDSEAWSTGYGGLGRNGHYEHIKAPDYYILRNKLYFEKIGMEDIRK